MEVDFVVWVDCLLYFDVVVFVGLMFWEFVFFEVVFRRFLLVFY